MTKEMKLLIFGPPGCGKGTLSKFITDSTHIAHISVGEMIREHIKAHDVIGKQAEELVSKGKLISDDITNQMVKERLSKSDVNHSFLLDGYPRDVEQAKFLTKIFQITGVIEMTLTDDMILNRLLKRGREDDIPKTIKDRIQLYKDTTRPVLNFMKEQKISVHKINGDYNMKTEAKGIVDKIVDWQNSIE